MFTWTLALLIWASCVHAWNPSDSIAVLDASDATMFGMVGESFAEMRERSVFAPLEAPVLQERLKALRVKVPISVSFGPLVLLCLLDLLIFTNILGEAHGGRKKRA